MKKSSAIKFALLCVIAITSISLSARRWGGGYRRGWGGYRGGWGGYGYGPALGIGYTFGGPDYTTAGPPESYCNDQYGVCRSKAKTEAGLDYCGKQRRKCGSRSSGGGGLYLTTYPYGGYGYYGGFGGGFRRRHRRGHWGGGRRRGGGGRRGGMRRGGRR